MKASPTKSCLHKVRKSLEEISQVCNTQVCNILEEGLKDDIQIMRVKYRWDSTRQLEEELEKKMDISPEEEEILVENEAKLRQKKKTL